MNDLSKIPEFSKYFRTITPSEVAIDKEDIFYRDKYNDIINYIKVMLTNNDDMVIQEYVKPKGALLINISPGTDLLDFIKLISSNYYLDLIELDYNAIAKSQNKFLNSFDSIIKNLGMASKSKEESEMSKPEKDVSDQTNFGKIDNKKLIIINQQKKLTKLFQEVSLLQKFIEIPQNNDSYLNFLDSNMLIVWINYDLKEITENSSQLYNIFDLFIKIPILNEIERETILRHFLERNPKIVFDINQILNYTANWEVNDINQLLKVGIFKHYLNSELNETSNEITDILIDLIDLGEYIPSINLKFSEISEDIEAPEDKILNITTMSNQKRNEQIPIKDVSEIVDHIRQSSTSEFMLNQLYENAASKNYNELVLIIDKLHKDEPLEDNDKKLLAKFP
ncbi:MAG: hypothetical protein ACFE8L_07180, partial [Candidatus Hodarchaeota archaeon]